MFKYRWKGGTPPAQQKWDDLSAALLVHFAATIDSNLAFEMLRRVRQAPEENVSLFAERIFRLSKDA